ncbi:hypothetical protein Taro_045554, partial [Colocasia esculenta]|nr:hypothetical protein [Colocasia esculenta]
MEHPVVCLPTDVAAAVCIATSVEALPRQRFGVVLLCCPACLPGAWHLRACPVQSPREQTLELRGKRGLDSGAESFVELSCLGLGRRGVRSAFLAQTRQSLVSLALSALVPEPRSGVRCAEHCFRFVPDSVGFCGSRFLLLWLVRH